MNYILDTNVVSELAAREPDPNVIKWMNIPASLGYLMGGTSLLIMVGVAIDTLKQIESHLLMHHMDGFLTQRKKKL